MLLSSASRRWLSAGDLNGFLALVIDNLSVLAFLSAALIGIFHFPADVLVTRMVYAELPVDAPAFVPRLRAAGLLANAVGPHAIRLVCHLDVDRAGCERAADILRASLEGR